MATSPRPAFMIADRASSQITKLLANAVVEAGYARSKMLNALADSIRAGLFEADFRDVHQRIAENAQNATLAAYDGRDRKGPRAYRTDDTGNNRRYAGGALRRALAAPDFYRATQNGIAFGNVSVLNKEARHWARIAFGAGAIGTGAHSSFAVRWSNLVVASLGLDVPARPAFTIPRGYFYAPGTKQVQRAGTPGTGEFYPVGSRKPGTRGRPTIQGRMLTRGIEGTDFFSPGLRVIATELPIGYGQIYRRVWNDSARRTRAQISGVRLVRPARQNISVIAS